jgi:hypothetical protein
MYVCVCVRVVTLEGCDRLQSYHILRCCPVILLEELQEAVRKFEYGWLVYHFELGTS